MEINTQTIKVTCFTGKISIPNVTATSDRDCIADYFLQGPNKEDDKRASA